MNVTDLVLTPRPDTSLIGTVTTDDGKAPPFAPAGIRIAALASMESGHLTSLGTATPVPVESDWTFRFPDIDGPHLFRPLDLPAGWILKTISANGRDVTDTPFEVPPAIEGQTAELLVVLTPRSSGLSGDVLDDRGASVSDSAVIVFASDPGKWDVGSRFVRVANADREGRFSVTGLPAGSYLAIAEEFVADESWDDLLLQSLRSNAVALELREGATAQVTLKIRKQQ